MLTKQYSHNRQQPGVCKLFRNLATHYKSAATGPRYCDKLLTVLCLGPVPYKQHGQYGMSVSAITILPKLNEALQRCVHQSELLYKPQPSFYRESCMLALCLTPQGYSPYNTTQPGVHNPTPNIYRLSKTIQTTSTKI